MELHPFGFQVDDGLEPQLEGVVLERLLDAGRPGAVVAQLGQFALAALREFHAVAAPGLGGVAGAVGGGEDVLGVRLPVERRHADRHAEVKGLARVAEDEIADASAHPLGGQASLRQGHLLVEDDELVAAETRHGVRRADGVAQQVGDLDEQAIARRVAQ